MARVPCVQKTTVPSEFFFFLRQEHLQLRGESRDLRDSGAGGPAYGAQTKQEDPEGCWEPFLGRGQEVRA